MYTVQLLLYSHIKLQTWGCQGCFQPEIWTSGGNFWGLGISSFWVFVEGSSGISRVFQVWAVVTGTHPRRACCWGLHMIRLCLRSSAEGIVSPVDVEVVKCLWFVLMAEVPQTKQFEAKLPLSRGRHAAASSISGYSCQLWWWFGFYKQ